MWTVLWASESCSREGQTLKAKIRDEQRVENVGERHHEAGGRKRGTCGNKGNRGSVLSMSLLVIVRVKHLYSSTVENYAESSADN